MAVGKVGLDFENLSKKGCFLSFEWENPPFLVPPRNFWKIPLMLTPWKKSFRRP